MSKKFALLISFLVICLAVFLTQNKNVYFPAQKSEKTVLSVSQSVLTRDKKTTASLAFKNGETALMLLQNSHVVITKGEKENAFVTTIDGKTADSTKEFWSFYVNGKQATVGAGSYILKNNDTIEWKIEPFK